jgi:uncharacterized membrane protein YeaQ/YmgE (transglycosylase-associated protein family)
MVPPARLEAAVLWIISLLFIGLIAGAIARFLVPGRDPMGIGGTILLGVVGSFVGGFLAHVLFGLGDALIQPSRLLGSIIGAVIALLVYRAAVGDRTGRRGFSRA